MYSASPHWSFDPSSIELSVDLQNLLNLDLDVPTDSVAALLNAGTWWVYPISAEIGLRILPGAPLSRCPVVLAAESQALTIASAPSSLVPIVAFHSILGMDDRWQELAGLSKAGWAELATLHKALGGDDVRMEALRKVVKDARLRATCIEKIGSPEADKAYVDVFVRLDPSPHAATWWHYCLEAISGQGAPVPAPEAGPWNPAIAALAFVINHEQGKDGETDAAWRMAHEPPGVDSFPDDNGFVFSPMGGRGAENALAAAKTVVRRKGKAPAEWGKDPLWPAIEALATARKPYDGGAHLKCAKALQKAGRPEEAFAACMAASFWSFQAAGEPGGFGFVEALEIAKRAKWKDTEAALRVAREAGQEDDDDPDEEHED